MDKNEQFIYDHMDWGLVEAVCYADTDNPHVILGPHEIEKKYMVNVFVLDAVQVSIHVGTHVYTAYKQDDAGFFSALITDKSDIGKTYAVCATYASGATNTYIDPYQFAPVLTEAELAAFNAGKYYNVYEKIGAHRMTINGVEGVLFAVWAPYAGRVSVVGTFNAWDGRVRLMRRLGGSGVFELFVPGVDIGTIYKYEIKAKGGLVYLKADPYANEAELRPNNASVVADMRYEWTDGGYLARRAAIDHDASPMFVYEMQLGSFVKPDEENFYSYRELAPVIAEYVKRIGYTHIELMPVMEYPFDGSWGYQVTGYYAATKRHGHAADFMYFVDYMHGEGIGVLVDWVPAHFPRDAFGLASFDGTCLYEHMDPRLGAHPHWGTLIYNYGRPEVRNFLIANALFWVDKYHVDGIRMDAVASMLYLDYGRKAGEWIPNKFGGNYNLDAIDLLRELSDVLHARKDGALLIAEESTAFPKVSHPTDDDGLGFDGKWNMGWMNDFTKYMKIDPLFRKGSHGMLTFSMMYAYSERFLLVFSHDEVVHGKSSMLFKMPGKTEAKFANLRLAYGFMTGHPGKKLLFMGQDFGQEREWSEVRSLDWELVPHFIPGNGAYTQIEKAADEHSVGLHESLLLYVQDLIKLYKSVPSMYKLDYDPDGFHWVSCEDADHSLVTFYRQSGDIKDLLFFVCNFTPVVYEDAFVAVPKPGTYTEILNSDDVKYGGEGHTNPKPRKSVEQAVDGQDQAIVMTIPPLAVAVFAYKEPVAKAKAALDKSKTEKKM